MLDSPSQGLMISRCHARLRHVSVGQQSYWVLTDLGSTNGCLWNGVRVKETKLSGKNPVPVFAVAVHGLTPTFYTLL